MIPATATAKMELNGILFYKIGLMTSMISLKENKPNEVKIRS